MQQSRVVAGAFASVIAAACLWIAEPVSACTLCNSETGLQLREMAFGPDFLRKLSATLAPAPVLLAFVGLGMRKGDRLLNPRDRSPLLAAGVALGIGLGGFVDGILFHQLLQLHSMLSALYPPTSVLNIEHNMVWDGLFHVFAWCTTMLGVVLLWRAGATPDVVWCGRTLFGAGLCGWGLFNVVEGTIDHFLLQVHHVVESQGLSVWDWLFLASGILLIALGVGVMRSARSAVPAPRPGPA
jgi:uncharacterized membrane protein